MESRWYPDLPEIGFKRASANKERLPQPSFRNVIMISGVVAT